MELGADTAPPAPSGEHTLSLQLHESLVRNAGHMLLRGVTITDRDLAAWMKIALGEIPREAREYRLGEHLEPWSVTLADEHPLAADFADGQATVTLRTQGVTIDDRMTAARLAISVTYRLHLTSHGPRLVREGLARVAPDADGEEPAPREVTEFLARKANGFFISEIWFDGLVPPAGGQFERFANSLWPNS